jgi:hypothetical protein
MSRAVLRAVSSSWLDWLSRALIALSSAVRADDVFQLAEVVGQAVFGVAPLLDFGGDIFKLLVGDFHQHADFIVGVPAGHSSDVGSCANRGH